jgi:hypothetical protein
MGEPTDADGDVLVTMKVADSTTEIFTDFVADHNDDGDYSITLTSADTAEPGDYDLTWSYELSGDPQTYVSYITVGQSAPAYDALPQAMKDLVETTWIQFADGFDSFEGGPNLQDYFQTNFNRGRLAQLLQHGLDQFNLAMQPVTTYTLYPEQNQFPYHQFPGLLEQTLKVEIIKHLIRSYVEQPEAMNVGTARLDRRDYMDRWRSVLDMEKADLDKSTEIVKMQLMGLGRARVLISGGVYGNYGPTRLPNSAAARPRYWTRFY